MIPVADQASLVSRIVEALVHETFSTSYAVVIPPCFGEDALGDAFVEQLAKSERRPLVASITIDHIRTPIAYVQELHRQWSLSAVLGPAPRRGENSTVALMNLLGAVPADRPAVQVVRRFEKFLDALDTQVLGTMRSLESSKKLRSIVCSPYTYDDLKRRWVDGGKKLLASNYGDSHCSEVVRPLEKADALRECVRHGVQKHVAEFIVEQTGGYPEPCFDLVGTWTRQYASKDRPLTNDVKRELAEVARRRLGRFVEHLDMPGQSEHRDAVVALHYGMGTEHALATLDRHPWKEAILDGTELRAEVLGPTAAARLRGTQAASFDTARKLYARGQYRQARDVIEAGKGRTPSEQLLLLHAESMTLLIDPDDGLPGLDTDWKRLRKLLAEASELVANPEARIPAESIHRIRERYDELASPAQAIVDVTRTGDRRIVDALARTAPREAFWLMLLQQKRAGTHVRHSSATQAAFALPEQVFRIWAQWVLSLDYYRQPVDGGDTWAEVRRRWRHGDILPTPGEQFPSFDAFAWFALVAAEREGIPAIGRPESTWKGLEHALSLLQIRRDHAHAIARCTKDDRCKLFDLIDRWMAALLPSCKAHPEAWSLHEFEDMLRPLPLLVKDGDFDWF